jgi:hypothetical protein
MILSRIVSVNLAAIFVDFVKGIVNKSLLRCNKNFANLCEHNHAATRFSWPPHH